MVPLVMVTAHAFPDVRVQPSLYGSLLVRRTHHYFEYQLRVRFVVEPLSCGIAPSAEVLKYVTIRMKYHHASVKLGSELPLARVKLASCEVRNVPPHVCK